MCIICRNEYKNKCISTSHPFSFEDFMLIAPELKKIFKTYRVDIKENETLVTININL